MQTTLHRLLQSVRSNGGSEDGLHIANKIDEIMHRLELWANDISVRTSTKAMSAAEILEELDGTESRTVLDLHKSYAKILHYVHEGATAILPPNFDRLRECVLSIQDTLAEIENVAHLIRAEYRDLQGRGFENVPGSVVLCFDGGGVKSYSSLLIVKALMEKVGQHYNSKALRPRELVDYMFGSSSGGLIAIMLGRLKMDVEEGLSAFEIYANDIFGQPRTLHALNFIFLPNRTKYGKKLIEKASRNAVKDFGQDQDGRVWKANTFAAPYDHCRTGVIASCIDPTRRGSVPHIFRNYDITSTSSPHSHELVLSGRSSTGVTVKSSGSAASSERNVGAAGSLRIWQVARATAAAPLYFDAMHIDKKTFLDGGIGSNNPSLEAFHEVCDNYRHSLKSSRDAKFSPISLFISIGSGLSDYNYKRPRGFLKEYRSLITLLRSVATDTEEVETFMRRSAVDGFFPYFRFNVDQGLGDLRTDEWKRPKKGKDPASSKTLRHIRDATNEYINRKEVQKDLDDCARWLIVLRRLRL